MLAGRPGWLAWRPGWLAGSPGWLVGLETWLAGWLGDLIFGEGGWTNARTNINADLPIQQDFVPYGGRCSKTVHGFCRIGAKDSTPVSLLAMIISNFFFDRSKIAF